MHVPESFGVVTPYLFIDGCEEYVRFLMDAFGAQESGRSIGSDGRLANCQLVFAGTTIMLSEASNAFPATRAAFYLYVADADAAMERACAAGADRIMDVADMPYGDRQGGVRDGAGTIWWISQRLTADPYF